MNDINDYKIEVPEKRAMMIACDYVGSYQTSCNQPIKEAREEFFEKIIQIAKIKKHNIISFSFFSTNTMEAEEIKQVTEILETEKIKNEMKQVNVRIILGGQYRKRNSENISKYEDIVDELEDLSYEYNITDMIAFDDTTMPISKIFFMNEKVFKMIPNANIDYISVTDSFLSYEEYRSKSYKLNIYGKFTDEQYINLTEEKIKKFKGLGNFGYMSDGLSKILDTINQ